MQNQVSLQMPHHIVYWRSVNTNYSVDDKVGDHADPWQHNYSKINLNYPIRNPIQNKRDSQK